MAIVAPGLRVLRRRSYLVGQQRRDGNAGYSREYASHARSITHDGVLYIDRSAIKSLIRCAGMYKNVW